jgi:flavin reductase (DIM6/NTAB) family NADH-FMN oxidoreductase RutF
MTRPKGYEDLVSLRIDRPIWERFFTVAPLVVVGSREEDGSFDLAPKHMAGPMSWENYFGFVCAPSHSTYTNIAREECFTVSYPRSEQVVLASLAASPRCEDGSKTALEALPTIAARKLDGVFLADASLCLECRLHRVVDDLGPNSLILGRIVAAYVHRGARRRTDRDDQEVIRERPPLVYLHPRRFAEVRESQGFPMPAGFKR